MAKCKKTTSSPRSLATQLGEPMKTTPEDNAGNKPSGDERLRHGGSGPSRPVKTSVSACESEAELVDGLGSSLGDDESGHTALTWLQDTSSTATLARQLHWARIMATPSEDTHTTMPALTSQTTPDPTLVDPIQSLAQELQDLILDFALIAGVRCGVVIIGPQYPPPWQLSVNFRTRQVVTPIYYRTAVFQMVLDRDPVHIRPGFDPEEDTFQGGCDRYVPSMSYA